MQAQKGDPDLESAQSALPQSQLNEVEDTTCSNLGEGMQGNLDRDFSRSLGTGTKLCTDASGAPGSDYDTKSAATYTASQVRRQHDRRQGGAIGRRPDGRRSNSLELRKVPDHILLMARSAIMDDLGSQSSRDTGSDGVLKKERSSSKLLLATHGWFHRLLLNPKYSLRKQMMLTFGSVSALAIVIVMIVAIIASVLTGNSIKDESATYVETFVKQSMGTTARYVAETLSPRIMPPTA